ncbi:MAG: pyridoxal phosphate-dependent aminotransferase [Candidatus Gracilibacteria bacterium]|jgi:aspartate/methionine/tyrosine aminotransferase
MPSFKLTDNKWGFDIAKDNPFKIFRLLREIAIENVGEENVVDLSRGDPGYGFSPSKRGRRFYSFLLEIDTILNNPSTHFVADNREDFDTIWEKIQKHAKEVYAPKRAEKLLEDFYFFLIRIEKYAKQQGLNWSKRDIVFEMFKYSTVSGGCYHDPKGEVLARLIVANHYNEKYNFGVDHKDLVLIQGVSHGIGTIFKTLYDKEIGYLKEGDSVMITSPAYATYNMLMENEGIKIFSIPIDITTGRVDGDIDEILKNSPENLKMICLIDPNNPTGFMCDEEFLKKISDFAKKRDILIISDEVYADFFFEKKKSILNFAPERTIFIGGRSKIERSTGLRFGEYVITKEGQKYIAEKILSGKLAGNKDLLTLLIAAKGPSTIFGEFQHTTFVAGPSQYLGISHMIFGDQDRAEYLKRIRVNMENFYDILGFKYNKNLYYAGFDLKSIPGCTKGDMEAEDIFVGLAKKGVVYIPANRFYSDEERKKKDYRGFARASLPNLTFSNLQKAAKMTKEFMMS